MKESGEINGETQTNKPPADHGRRMSSKTQHLEKGDYVVRGFKAGAIAAGIKKKGGLDLALILSEKEAIGAGVFTTNKVKAAPVLVSEEHLRGGKVRAIIANSGNANACTGNQGFINAKEMAQIAARELGIEPQEVLVASTGVIGAQIDISLVSRSIRDLANSLSPEGLFQALEGIMTTDSFPKVSRFKGIAGGRPYSIVGVAKGAGMIMPQMATMLCFVLTDLDVRLPDLKRALSLSVEKTFNRISVDGDTSTNDEVLIMANGMAGNGMMDSADEQTFREGLTSVMSDLATMIVRDGEGATKLIHVHVRGAASSHDALTAARTISNSPLVKTAFYGQDPNWGRIMAALGRSGVDMKQEDVEIFVDHVKIVEKGVGMGVDQEKAAAECMRNKEFSVTVDLCQGIYEDHVITCDLSHQYVSINADYRT
jgi:glutamate N-acetyltransferase / amino-acid N-acetyltransferase